MPIANYNNKRSQNKGSYLNRSQLQIKNRGLTEDGRNWLTRALDPFHDDVSVKKAGLPDYTPNATIVKEHTRSIQVSRPAATAADATWNMVVMTLPNLEAQTLQKSNEYANGNVSLNTADAVLGMGTVTILTWPSANGTDWFLPSTNNTFVAGLEAGRISLYPGDPNLNQQKVSRLIGGGFEVCNDTAQLYKSGNVTACSCPQLIERDQIGSWEDQTAAILTGSPVFSARLGPTNLEGVRANPNSVSWEAEHGIYMPFRMEHTKNELKLRTCIPIKYSTAADGAADQVLISDVTTPFVAGRFPNVEQKAHLSPLATNIAFFTGLSYSSAFTVNVKFIEEIAPISDPELLAFGPEMYMSDPLALELYQRAIMKLPVAVTYAENASAEFWSKVVKTLGGIAAPIAGSLGGPLASSAVNAITNAVVNKIEKKSGIAPIAAKQQQKVANGMTAAGGRKK